MGVARRGAAIAALAALLAAAVAIRFWPPRPSRPGVLVVTIDTLRTDHAAPGRGNPAIEAFLRRAVWFRKARTVMPLTLPAHVSLFTGLLPARHGIHDNVAPRLPERRGFPLLAEEFRDAGYDTAAFVACSIVGEETGIAAGFETFDAPPQAPEFSGEYGDPPAEERVKAPVEWLRGRERGFFLWVHFYDPHSPYLPFAGDARREATFAAAPEPVRYAGEIRRADAALETLLAALPGGTIVVVASDHGEGLFEHDEATHGPLCYASTADAFLAVEAGGLAGGTLDDAPRSLCDVAPTLRELCGLEPRDSDGTSLLSAARPVVLTESLHTWLIHGWGQCFSATDGRFTLVESGRKVELFDRKEDPKELRPLPLQEHEAYERLSRAIEELRAGPVAGGVGASDAASPYGPARRAFRRYLSRGENALLPDPRDGFPRWIMMESASRLLHRGSEERNPALLGQAIAVFRELGSADPGSPASHYYLLHAFARLAALSGRPEDHVRAAAAGREALRLGYHDPAIVKAILTEALSSGDASEIRLALEAAEGSSLPRDVELDRLLAEARAKGG